MHFPRVKPTGIFRNMFLEQKDLQITDVVWNFFDAVKSRWPEAWEYTGSGIMLNKTHGFRALMRFLRTSYLPLTSPGGVPKMAEFKSILDRINLDGATFTIGEYNPGTSGESKLFNVLLEKAKLKS